MRLPKLQSTLSGDSLDPFIFHPIFYLSQVPTPKGGPWIRLTWYHVFSWSINQVLYDFLLGTLIMPKQIESSPFLGGQKSGLVFIYSCSNYYPFVG